MCFCIYTQGRGSLVYGVAQSRTRLKRLSSSSSSSKDDLNFSLNHKLGLCNGMFTSKILCIFHVYAQSGINTISISKKDIKCYLKWNKITETDVIFYFPGVCVRVCVCVCVCVSACVCVCNTLSRGLFNTLFKKYFTCLCLFFFFQKQMFQNVFFFHFLKSNFASTRIIK